MASLPDLLLRPEVRPQVIDGCVNPQAVRYILPALGLRAVF